MIKVKTCFLCTLDKHMYTMAGVPRSQALIDKLVLCNTGLQLQRRLTSTCVATVCAHVKVRNPRSELLAPCKKAAQQS